MRLGSDLVCIEGSAPATARLLSPPWTASTYVEHGQTRETFSLAIGETTCCIEIPGTHDRGAYWSVRGTGPGSVTCGYTDTLFEAFQQVTVTLDEAIWAASSTGSAE